MTHRVADEAHPLQHHERADYGARHPNQRARHEGAHEEVVGEWLEEEVDRVHS